MEEPEHATERIPQRLLKYLPWMMAGHWLITIPTFVISIALAYATYVQADATRKIQQSETWPYVSYATSNASPEGDVRIAFTLTNGGVGPAKLKAMEFRYDGKPMANPRQFLELCCGYASGRSMRFTTGGVGGVLRPGDSIDFIRLTKLPETAAMWDRLQDERWKVKVKTCYCSIFDDCWVMESGSLDPTPVKSCPTDWKLYEEQPVPAAVAAEMK
jgi:hypothetical protein